MELKEKFRAIAIEEDPKKSCAHMPAGANHREKFFSDENREAVIGRIAQEIYDRRMSDSGNPAEKEYEGLPLYGDEIEKLLRRNGIKKDTEKARKFMEKWDYDQAAKIYERMFGKKESVEKEIAPAEPGVKKIEKDALPEEERGPVKATALHTIAKTPKFEDLNADTLEEGDKKIIGLSRKLWGAPTVHGFLDPENLDPETGEPSIKRETDLDGRGYLAILKKAGVKFDMKDIDYVEQGESSKSGKGIVGDTSGEDGVMAKNFGELLIADHHGDKSGRDTSATRNKYEALVASGMIERSEALDAFAEFVTKEDNKDYTDEECKNIIENFDGNLIGLQRYMNGEDVIKVFEKYADKGEILNPYEKLSDEVLKDLKFAKLNGDEPNLKYVLQKLTNTKEALQREAAALKNGGLIIETDRYGSILIDAGRFDGKNKKWKKRLGSNLAIEAARAEGHGGVVWWNPRANSFSIQVANEDIDFSLPEGQNYRGRYWLKGSGQERLKTTLEEILGKLSGKKNFQMDEKLKEALEKGGNGKKTELTEEQNKLFVNLIQKAQLVEIETKFPPDDLEMSDKLKKSWTARRRSLNLSGGYLKDIARSLPAEEVEIFGNKIMNEFLEEYRNRKREKEKTKIMSETELKDFKQEILEEIKNVLQKRFGGVSGAMVNYFRNMFNIEYLLNNK